MNNSVSKKKILKNTIILYVRMIFTMFIALYTSRIILKALGIDDFGLYNVVGGVVAVFSFIQTSLTSATQRFMSYELGKSKEEEESNRVFCSSITTHILLAGVIFVLCETFGLWFLDTQVNIPEGRETAANCIYHFSVISICVSMLNVPLGACVISHEDMGFFAFISILDALLKLGIAIVIAMISSVDRLILYGFLIMFITIINQVIYIIFCRKSYNECRFRFTWDKTIIGRILGFTSWTLLGQLAVMASNQGASILVNIFYSVRANAAIGVGQQVNYAISGLVANFQTAYQPQITKAYAAKDYGYQAQLIFQASKVSYFLMFIVSLPVIFNINDLLDLWLGEVPLYSNQFCVCFMMASMLNAIGGPLWMSIFATGNIKRYQIATSMAYLFDIAIVYMLLRLGFPPFSAAAVQVFANFAIVLIRVYYCKKVLSFFSARAFIKRVLLPLTGCTFFAIIVGYGVFHFAHSLPHKLGASLFIVTFTLAISYAIGLNSNEKNTIRTIINNKIHKK